MKALAIDTSTAVAGIAVADEQGLLAEYMLKGARTHSQNLVPMLREVLERLGMAPGDIDVYAAVTGPGSFTGLRIGVATVKSIAYATGKRTAGVLSLDALAYAASFAGDCAICPIIDARNSQVYTAVYKVCGGGGAQPGIPCGAAPLNTVCGGGMPLNISGCMGIHISGLAELLREKHGDGRIMFTGDGVQQHRDFLKRELGGRCMFMPDFMLRQMAAPAALIALASAARGETAGSAELLPFYLRPSQAEREYLKKHLDDGSGTVKNNMPNCGTDESADNSRQCDGRMERREDKPGCVGGGEPCV